MSEVITNANLTSKVLTQKMPLSDAFNRALTSQARMGVHHGFALSFSDAAWPNGSYSTQNLKVSAGSAMVGGVKTNEETTKETILMSAILAADLTIDLEALDTPIISTDGNVYYVILYVDYTAPTVNEDAGLVLTVGTNEAQLIITQSTADGAYDQKGIVLGQFSRAGKYVETFPNYVLGKDPVAIDNGDGGYKYSMVEAAETAPALRANLLTQLSNLHKHVRVEGMTGAAALAFATTTMPLAGIAASKASNTTDLGGWSKPIDWLDGTAAAIYETAGIYKDVEKFEVFNCRFSGDMNFAFHRTPGHNKMADWVGTGDVAKLVTKAEIVALPDRGALSFTFDGNGSIFEGDLNLDLVLDFTGNAHDHVFKIYLKNLKVMGNLTVNYGQSWLGMAGGSLAIIEEENVTVYGATHTIRPWPACEVATDAAVTSTYDSWGYATAQYFMNTAASISFTGFTGTQPSALTNWRRTTPVNTHGVLVLAYLHDAISGVGALAMDNPWLYEGSDGAIVLKNSSLPSNLLGAPAATETPWRTNIRVRVQNCKYLEMEATDPSGYVGAPVFVPAGDGVYTVYGFNTGDATDVQLKDALTVPGDLTVVGSITAAALTAAGAAAANSLGITLDAAVGHDLDVGRDLDVTRDAAVGNDITFGHELAGPAAQFGTLHTSGYLSTAGYLVVTGYATIGDYLAVAGAAGFSGYIAWTKTTTGKSAGVTSKYGRGFKAAFAISSTGNKAIADLSTDLGLISTDALVIKAALMTTTVTPGVYGKLQTFGIIPCNVSAGSAKGLQFAALATSADSAACGGYVELSGAEPGSTDEELLYLYNDGGTLRLKMHVDNLTDVPVWLYVEVEKVTIT